MNKSLDLSYAVTVKSVVEFSENSVAFSEYMNFMYFDAVVVYVWKYFRSGVQGFVEKFLNLS